MRSLIGGTMAGPRRSRAPSPPAASRAAPEAAAKPKTKPKRGTQAPPEAAPLARPRPASPKVKAPRVRTKRPPRPDDAFSATIVSADSDTLTVRRLHRRDIKRVWNFLKLSFRDVNRETVEYQRPRSKERFEESYDDEGIEQLVFEVGGEVVGYAECAYEVTGSDNWINPRYFGSRDMRPLFVEELATHPDYQGRGVGSFMMEQLEHLARSRGCTHLVLEVAENNETALAFYRRRSFYKLDAAIFMAKRVEREPDLLPPRELKPDPEGESAPAPPADESA